jgi:hypothetical protein
MVEDVAATRLYTLIINCPWARAHGYAISPLRGWEMKRDPIGFNFDGNTNVSKLGSRGDPAVVRSSATRG